MTVKANLHVPISRADLAKLTRKIRERTTKTLWQCYRCF